LSPVGASWWAGSTRNRGCRLANSARRAGSRSTDTAISMSARYRGRHGRTTPIPVSRCRATLPNLQKLVRVPP